MSARDVAVLEFVARFGVVPRDAAARRAGTARSMTLRREKRLREAGLLAVEKPPPGVPFLLATRLGLEVCGRDDLLPARIALVGLPHLSGYKVCARSYEGLAPGPGPPVLSTPFRVTPRRHPMQKSGID